MGHGRRAVGQPPGPPSAPWPPGAARSWPRRRRSAVAAAHDGLDAVAALDLEGHRAALDLGHAHGQRHRHAHQRGTDVVDLDPRAHRVLARVQVRQQQFAAGDLDVAHQHRRGVDAGRLAHEVDRALAVDLKRGCGWRPGCRVPSSSSFLVVGRSSMAQVGLLHLGVVQQLGSRTLEHDAAGFHHVAAIGDGQRGACVLVHQQHRRAAAPSAPRRGRRSRPPAAAPGPCWVRRAAAAAARPSARGRWPASAAGRPTACRPAGRLSRSTGNMAQTRSMRARRAAGEGAQPQVVLHAQRREHLTPFGHLHDAAAHALAGRHAAPMSAPSKRSVPPLAGCTPDMVRSRWSCPRRWRRPGPPVRRRRRRRSMLLQRRDAAVRLPRPRTSSMGGLRAGSGRHLDAQVGLDHARIGGDLLRPALGQARPRSSTSTRSDTSITRRMLCSTRTTVVPSAASRGSARRSRAPRWG
jgi:hypothetical protein